MKWYGFVVWYTPINRIYLQNKEYILRIPSPNISHFYHFSSVLSFSQFQLNDIIIIYICIITQSILFYPSLLAVSVHLTSPQILNELTDSVT